MTMDTVMLITRRRESKEFGFAHNSPAGALQLCLPYKPSAVPGALFMAVNILLMQY